MAVITFLSDFGERDHYVAAVKAAIISSNPAQQVIDISHQINRHDIGHAAYVLGRVFKSFPEGSVHLVAVDPVQREASGLIAMKLENHYFVSHDSGLLTLISTEVPESVVKLENRFSTFTVKENMVPAAMHLAGKKSITELGEPFLEYQRKTDRQLKATKREMVGQVIHIDHFGNLVTNIRQHDFEKICEINGGNPAFTVRFAREVFSRLHVNFYDVEGGDCFVIFNSYGFLEIGINKGRADDLLGLKQDAPVIIEFKI